MIKYLESLGIKEFRNVKYTYKTKKIDILGDGSPFDTKTEIEMWELEGCYKYINITIGVDNEWSTAFSARYFNKTLFDTTKIANYIGEKLVHKLELSYMDGLEDEEGYYFTSLYNNSIEVLKELLKTLGPLKLESQIEKDIETSQNIPFSAFFKLKDNILENVKDLSDVDEINEVAEIFMEYNGEEYRSKLFLDSRLIFDKKDDQVYADLIEDLMYEYFNEDEILIELD